MRYTRKLWDWRSRDPNVSYSWSAFCYDTEHIRPLAYSMDALEKLIKN